MKEAVSIQGDSGSRIVFLNTEYCNTPSLPDSEDSQVISTFEAFLIQRMDSSKACFK